MASKALTCYTSAVGPNKASQGPTSLGSVPRSVFFASPTKTCSSASKTSSMAVRAQQYGTPQFHQYGSVPFSTTNIGVSKPQDGGQPISIQVQGQPISTQGQGQGQGHTPWYTTGDESAMKMRIDLPGLSFEDLDVKVEGNTLVIKDLGRQIFSPYNTTIELPLDCVKEQVVATLKNGVLHVSVPKKHLPPPPPNVVHIPVKTSLY